MIPIPSYEAVKCAWLEIEAEGFVLHGFLLYSMGDHQFPKYIDGSGLSDLEGWTGRECAVFVIYPPSEAWIEYTSKSNHPWWRIFGNTNIAGQDRLREMLEPIGNIEVALDQDHERRTIASILTPSVNQFTHQAEVYRILHQFGCRPTEHPCFIFFKSLRDSSFWFVTLADMLNQPVDSLRTALRTWFEQKEFAKLMKDARDA